MTIRTLVVDDSIVFRKVVRDALASIESVEVVGVARDGQDAVEKIKQLKPDLVTLDVEMPGLDGLGVLDHLKQLGISTQVIMVSSLTGRGAQATTTALSRGAIDFILKPTCEDVSQGITELRAEFAKRISAIHPCGNMTTTTRKPPSYPTGQQSSRPTAKPSSTGAKETPRLPSHVQAIFMGISTGGPKALSQVVPHFPSDLVAPLILVQHMPAMFTATMANTLNSQTSLEVVEARDGMPLTAGGIYIAPGGKQLAVHYETKGVLTAVVNDSPAIKSCKPSVDYLMKSVPSELAAKSLAIIATGMGDDGRDGCEYLRQAGATVWSQSEATCTVFGMPRQVQESGLSHSVFDLDDLPRWLSQLKRSRYHTNVTFPQRSSTPNPIASAHV